MIPTFMPLRQKLFALTICCVIFVLIIELVRRRRLKEEYSVLWFCACFGMFTLVIKYDWLVRLTKLIGAGLATSTLFVGALTFLMLVAVQFSIKISRLSEQVKNLAQDNALLRTEIETLRAAPKQPTGGQHAT
jgi:vacuolar-type H+-ATPase subunit I/STV1